MLGEREWLFRIQDMLDAINSIEMHLDTLSEDDFLRNDLMQKGVERYFEILGEAARYVPKEAQDKYPDILWSKIIGMRHRISHNYSDVNPHIIWSSYEIDLAPLKQNLENMLKQEKT